MKEEKKERKETHGDVLAELGVALDVLEGGMHLDEPLVRLPPPHSAEDANRCLGLVVLAALSIMTSGQIGDVMVAPVATPYGLHLDDHTG
jgi:hypothetical protein